MNRILDLAGITTPEVLTEGKKMKMAVDRIQAEVMASLKKVSLTGGEKASIRSAIEDAYEAGHDDGYEEGSQS